MNVISISAAGDDGALASLEKKRHLVRDLTTGVAKGFKPGLYLYGPGGMGKSYTVLQHLRFLEACYLLHNSRMTAKGLFLALKQAPDDLPETKWRSAFTCLLTNSRWISLPLPKRA
jgi:hypothetical protein